MICNIDSLLTFLMVAIVLNMAIMAAIQVDYKEIKQLIFVKDPIKVIFQNHLSSLNQIETDPRKRILNSGWSHFNLI